MPIYYCFSAAIGSQLDLFMFIIYFSKISAQIDKWGWLNKSSRSTYIADEMRTFSECSMIWTILGRDSGNFDQFCICIVGFWSLTCFPPTPKDRVIFVIFKNVTTILSHMRNAKFKKQNSFGSFWPRLQCDNQERCYGSAHSLICCDNSSLVHMISWQIGLICHAVACENSTIEYWWIVA